MLGVVEFYQASPLDPENADPLKLVFVPGAVILFHAGVDTSSASDAPGKVEAVSPEGIGKGLLSADLELLAVFFQVSLFELGDDPLLVLRGHLSEMLLKKVFLFLLRTSGEKRKGQARQSGEGSPSDEFST